MYTKVALTLDVDVEGPAKFEDFKWSAWTISGEGDEKCR